MSLEGKTILITGAARRIGRRLALAAAQAGADILLHHANSPLEADQVKEEISALGRKTWILQADFRSPQEAEQLVARAAEIAIPYAIVHNASIFEPLSLAKTGLDDWQRHMDVNLTAPFLISREFAARLPEGEKGRIITLLDWRALRPGSDHFPYTISKAALAALTRSLAVSLAPNISVNGLALGAILPPSTGGASDKLLETVPARRWANPEELEQAFLFLLDGPEYITGEILHLDGGRHLV